MVRYQRRDARGSLDGTKHWTCELGSHQTLRSLGRFSMNRTVVIGVAVFALFLGSGMAMTESTAEAGWCGNRCGSSCGGHFRSRRCGGGLFARMRARHAARRCCRPVSCCQPTTCCEPAPACDPAPACGGCGSCGGCVSHSGCGSCGGCGAAVAVGSGCSDCGGSVIVEGAPAEVVVPPSASDAPPPAPVPDASADEA